MRNLICVAHGDHPLDLAPEFGWARWLTVDHDAGLMYICGDELHVACLTANEATLRWVADVRDLAEASGTAIPLDAAVTSFAHAPDLDAIFIALSTGGLLLLRPTMSSSHGPPVTLEEVGAVEGGVAGAAWSPDGEVLAVVGCAGQLLVMNSEWELLAEGSVASNDPAFPQPTAPPAPLPGSPAATSLAPSHVGISWRGDGNYFATSTVDAPGAAPRVRVWDRATGELHALGEAAESLFAPLAWQPNCRHLFAAQALPEAAAGAVGAAGEEAVPEAGGGPSDGGSQEGWGAQGQAPQVKHVGAWKRELRRQQAAAAAAAGLAGAPPNRIVLFERNGLQHGGFDVPTHGTIEALHWSPDSEFLAVVLAQEQEGEEGPRQQRTLQLWHRSNWHWYLKHERRFPMCRGLVVAWAEAGAALKLHAVTADGAHSHAIFAPAACVSSLGTAAVIDGAALLLTPLRLGIVPPPMAAVCVACPAPIVCVAARECGGEDEAVAAVLSDGSVAVVEACECDLWEETLDDQLEVTPWERPGPPHLLPRLLHLVGEALQQGAVVRQAAWVSHHSLLLVVSGPQGDLLVEVAMDSSSASGRSEEAQVVCSQPAPGPVLSCVPRPERDGAVLQVAGGGLFTYLPGTGQLQPAADSLPCSCPHLTATPAAVLAADPTVPIAFGLSVSGQLWWGSRCLGRDVTSFVLRHRGHGGAFIIFTCRNHTMCSASLTAVLHATSAGAQTRGDAQPSVAADVRSGQQPPQQQRVQLALPPIAVRSIEEGSLLVAAPADGIDAVYQAPRGNLETVRPRALALPAVTAALDAGDFHEAWRLAVSNRLDLNVLADFKWPRVVQQAKEFVLQVGADQEVADFLAALAPGSTAAEGGLYAGVLAWCEASSSRDGPGNSAVNGWSGGIGALGGEVGGSDSTPGLNGVGPAATPPAAAPADKVAAVCEAVRAAVRGLRAEAAAAGVAPPPAQVAGVSWFKTELTSYSRCDDLEAALMLVKDAKEAELAAAEQPAAAAGDEAAGPSSPASDESPGEQDASAQAQPQNSGLAANGMPLDAPAAAELHRRLLGGRAASAEEGLKHLLLHAPEEAVYRAALGSYELEMAYMVVAHSQRDPGEYLMELQRFAAIPSPSLRGHAIDLHLGRHAAALRHLAVAGEEHFTAAVELARRHGLLRLLLSLCEGLPQRRGRVHVALAEDLECRNKHEDAALAFLASGDEERALRAYRLAGQWRPALALAARLGRDPERITAMAARLAADLADSHQQAEAAAVTLEYLGDVPGAVRLLAEGGEWREAVRVAYARSRPDLMETVMAPTAAAAATRILESAQEDAARVAKYWDRLQEVRKRRATLAAAVAAADEDSDLPQRDADGDMDTEAASMVSGMSVYTDATHVGASTATHSMSASTIGGKRSKKTKGKHKQGRNRGKVRQGSPEEEAQLANHLLALAPPVALCTEAGQLAELLILLGQEQDAGLLQRQLAALVAAQQAAVADVLVHPPPGESLQVGEEAARQVLAAGGPAALAALEGAAGAVPGGDLQRRAAEGTAAVGGSHWKWNILREP